MKRLYHKAHKILHHITDPLHLRLQKRSRSYSNWHKNPHHRRVHFSALSLAAFTIITVSIYIGLPSTSHAGTSFSASFNGSGFNADFGLGDRTATTDSSFPDKVSDGNGGYAISNTGQSTLKYQVDNNLLSSKGEISLRIKSNTALSGIDLTTYKMNNSTYVYFDSASEYYYISDSSNYRIVKTKIDGTGWTTLGSSGTGVGQFGSLAGISYEASTGYIYVADRGNSRIVKTKIDGSGWATFGTNGSGVNQFSGPNGITYDQTTGYFYIADNYNCRIVKTKFDGTGWTTYGSWGSGVGKFYYPADVAYDSSTGYMYVADSNNNRIVKTKIDGTGWATLGSFGGGVNQFKLPVGISFDSSTGFIYVGDDYSNRVIKTKIDGSGWVSYGTFGQGVGQFNYPSGVYYDSSTQYLHIVDRRNSRIVKTQIDNTGWTTFGSYGSIEDSFTNPTGIFYDPASDYIYMTDEFNYRIIKTKIDGTGWTSFGVEGAGIGQFDLPSGIFYDAETDYIYVADNGNSRIVKTKIDGTGWTTYGTAGSGVGQFSGPTGVYYDHSSGYLYIADETGNRIVKTKIDGTGWTTYGGVQGNGVGQFYYPHGITMDPATGYLYISDSNNNRIVKTKFDGTGWATLGNYSEGVGGFYRPYGIIYDPATDYIYVADWSRSQIVRTKIDGTGWATYGVKWGGSVGDSSAKGMFYDPEGLSFDPNTGYIYVADEDNERLVKTKMDGTGWVTYYSTNDRNIITTGDPDDFRLVISPVFSKIVFKTGSGGEVSTGTIALDTNWHTIRVSYDSVSGDVKLYLDDQLKEQKNFGSSASLLATTAAMYLGSDAVEPGKYFFSGLIDDFKITNFPSESNPPTNPTARGYADSSKTTEYTSGNWGNAVHPYFELSGASDDTAVAGYMVYYGTDTTADPQTTGTYQTGTTYTSTVSQVNNTTYYLRVRTVDTNGNFSDPATIFTYKYDNNPPDKVDLINVSPASCSAAPTFTFTWPVPADAESGLLGYEYKKGTSGTVVGYADTTLTTAPYQEGDNVLYVRSEDNAGNTSAWQTAVYCSSGLTYVLEAPKVTASATALNVSWATNKSTNGFVRVKQPDGKIFDIGSADLSFQHQVKVIGLSPLTQYDFLVRFTDAGGNATESDWYKATTLGAPEISSISVKNIYMSSASVSWDTSVQTISELKFGLNTASEQTISLKEGLSSTHSADLTALTPGSTYLVKIKSTDSDGYSFYSDVFTIKTLDYPKISEFRFEPISDQSSAGIHASFTTNVPTTTSVFYSPSTGVYKEVSTSEKTTDHQIDITNLSDDTTYQIYASGIDSYGNVAKSDINSVKTALDTRPPVISDVSIESKNIGSGTDTKAQIIVSFNTDEPATNQIEYGIGTSSDSYSQASSQTHDLQKSHLVTINNLDPSKIYHLRVLVWDKANNKQTSQDNIVITNKAKDSILNIILKALTSRITWLQRLGL